MDWWNAIIAVIFLFLIVIGWARPFMKLKRGSSQDVEELLNHLHNIGIKASRLDVHNKQAKMGQKVGLVEKCEGIIKLEEGNSDYISVVSVATPFGDRLFINYLVPVSSWLGEKGDKKTRLVRQRDWAKWGRVVNVGWRGNSWLSRELNYDLRLKDKLGQAELEGSILILPDGEYAKVRVTYQLPSADLFQAIDIIAGHVRSVW